MRLVKLEGRAFFLVTCSSDELESMEIRLLDSTTMTRGKSAEKNAI